MKDPEHARLSLRCVKEKGRAVHFMENLRAKNIIETARLTPLLSPYQPMVPMQYFEPHVSLLFLVASILLNTRSIRDRRVDQIMSRHDPTESIERLNSLIEGISILL